MGNTELRGKVVWFLLTCRPDLLPVDLKRQGRAEEHLALFYPESGEERRALLRAMLRKSGSKVAADDIEAFACKLRRQRKPDLAETDDRDRRILTGVHGFAI